MTLYNKSDKIVHAFFAFVIMGITATCLSIYFTEQDLVMLVVGIVGALIEAAVLATPAYKRHAINRLKRNGECVIATIKEVIPYKNDNVYQYPFNIICAWVDPRTSQTVLFRSQDIWGSPIPAIRKYKITTFPVYINPQNPKKYYVDLSALEPPANPGLPGGGNISAAPILK